MRTARARKTSIVASACLILAIAPRPSLGTIFVVTGTNGLSVEGAEVYVTAIDPKTKKLIKLVDRSVTDEQGKTRDVNLRTDVGRISVLVRYDAGGQSKDEEFYTEDGKWKDQYLIRLAEELKVDGRIMEGPQVLRVPPGGWIEGRYGVYSYGWKRAYRVAYDSCGHRVYIPVWIRVRYWHPVSPPPSCSCQPGPW